MQKQKLLIFSDCYAYSGSENVIENILLSEKINSQYDIHFVYGYNRSYENRFKERAELLGLDVNRSNSVYLLSPDWSVNQYKILSKLTLTKIILFIQVLFLKTLKLLCISHVFNFYALKLKFKQISPDIIYINNGGYPASLQCCIAVFVASSLKVGKVYFNINNMATPRIKIYDKFLDIYINRCVTKFITASFAAQQHAIEERNLKKDKFVRIPNTIFNDILIAEKYKAPAHPQENTIFGSIGLLTHRKGYHVLLEAVKLLVHDYKVTNFKVLLIGDGEDKEPLFVLCKKHNIDIYVNFLGFKSNPLNELKNFDVFILPSIRNEDFPYVILEAMLLSKPVIGTKVAGMPEQIVDGITGFIVEPAHAVDLAKSMMRIIQEKEKIEQMGLMGQEKYRSEFCYTIVEDMYFKLFASLS